MSGIVSEDYGVGRSSDGISSGQRCQSGEALAEWRSSEQVENGTPSTSPPYWDTDDDDDDCGPKPSELYGKFTWKIENFSQISKRELRSNAFEVGGYKWYILIYPQGCDVCNHLSLFLCVANHDKLLPGWSHFAQFTIAVVNKDPKKSKYSDTLHRFWKKEHDWGWKKFMELSKVLDGFIVSDTLVIKAQVQVIREKSHRPFRCLDCQYRRELVRVYLTNVEQICRRFVEERRGKLGKFIEDKMRWSSFCAFWLGVDQNARRRMSREKTDVILKVVVKHFFIEKEVTSTLVMDSLYSGLKALECQSKSKKGRAKLLDIEETPAPIVCVENDMFVLVDDVLLLLERASVEPLPPKDEKGPQNRTKDGSSGEDFNKDSIERDERRLTELGRRTVEIFVLAHIFSNRIEVAYKEAVALKKQEELIREEEAAGQAESEQKAKRGTADKERRTKKKQNKHKRSNRKGKDKGKDEKSDVAIQDKQDSEGDNSGSALNNLAVAAPEKSDTLADGSDVSCIGDDSAETPQPDLEDQDASPVNWDTDTSEVHPATEASSSGVSELPVQNGRAEKKSTFMDDSSSTCSTDSVPSVVTNGPYKGNSVPNYRSQTSPGRGKSRCSKERGEWTGSIPDVDGQPSELLTDGGRVHDASGACRAAGPESDASALSLTDRMQWLEHHLVEKVPSNQRTVVEASSYPNSPPRNLAKNMPLKPVSESALQPEPCLAKEMSSSSSRQIEKAVPLRLPSPQIPSMSKPDVPNSSTLSQPTASLHGETPMVHNKVSAVSRPSSAPLIPGPRPSAPVVSMAQTAPMLARSVSAAGRLGTDPLPATHSCAPQSYRNAIMGKTMSASQVAITPPSSSTVSLSLAYLQHPSELVSSSIHSPQSPGMKDNSLVSGRSGFTFGSVTPEILQKQPEWVGCSHSQLDTSSNVLSHSSLANGIRNIDFYGSSSSGARKYFGDEAPAAAGLATRQAQGGGVSPDEFPHLDIINYLLDEEYNIGKAANTVLQPNNGHHHHSLGRQFTFPGDMSVSADLGFDRMEGGYHNEGGMHQLYHQTSSGHFDGGLMRDTTIPVLGLSGYANGQMDGMMQNHQWQGGVGASSAADMSLLRMRNTEGDGYLYHHQMPEYSTNLACGVNGYTIYRPSN